MRIVEADGAEAVAVAGNVDDAGALGSEDLFHDEVGQEKVPEVIGSKLHLEAIRRHGVRDGHDAGVVDDNVNLGHVAPPVVDLLGRPPHRVHGAEVDDQVARLDAGVSCDDALGELPELGGVAAGEDEELWGCGGGGFDKGRAEAFEGYARGEDCLALDDGGVVVDEVADGGRRSIGGHGEGFWELMALDGM